MYLALLLLSTLLACQNTSSIKAYNSAPTIEILSHSNGVRLREGESVEFFAQISDLNHDASELSVGWFSGEEVLCDWTPPADDGGSACSIAPSISMTSIRAEARDPDQAGGMTELEIEVLPTEAPTIELLSPLSSERYFSNVPVQFAANISDAEDPAEALTIQWNSDRDGPLALDSEPDSNGYISDFFTLSEGEHIISLVVEDTMNKSATIETLIVVGIDNTPPSCAILEPQTNTASTEGESVFFRGEALDPDGDTASLSIHWHSDQDGLLAETSPNATGETSFTSTELSRNTHVITMTATDTAGTECQDDIIYTIGSPPSISLITPTNGDIYDEGSEVFFSAQISDPEDNATDMNVRWESSIDGILNSLPPDSTGLVAFVDRNLHFGTHTITATVTDTDGLFAQQSVTTNINGVPTAPSVEITPDPAYTTDALTVITSGAIDPEGSPLSYSYAWYQNSILTALTGASLAAENTTKGEEWTVRVTPSDGISDGPYVETSTTIVNSPPTVGSISISPTSPSTQDTILCTATGIDSDGDATTISYSWLINGSPVSGTSNTLSGPFVQGDIITCRAVPNDGTIDGTASTSEITIMNAAPVISSVLLSPLNVYTNDLLNATASASDSEGAQLSYTWNWYVDDGTGFQLVLSNQTMVSTDQLDGTLYFERGNTVYVELSVSDSTTTTSLSSGPLTILNSPPTAFNVLISPLAPAAGADDLLCSAQESDSDLDSVSLEYSWTVNGAETEYTSNTIPAEDTIDGELWTCSVVAYDGLEYGPISTKSTTIGADVPDAIGSSFCSAAGSSADSTGYTLYSCLSAQEIGSGELFDDSGYQLQLGTHFVYTPE